MSKGIVMLAAGGTGGHLFPAEALAHELKSRGFAVHLITDSRAERFAGKFPADEIHVVPSATIGSKNPVSVAKALYKLWNGTRIARALLQRVKPVAIAGFGGYPTLPPLMAAAGLGLPTMIHEQNAVMGRANKVLAGRVRAIAGGFLPENNGHYSEKTVTTGNPVRPAVLEAAQIAYHPSNEDEPFELVVFGGSQGAQFFSSAVPNAISLLDENLRKRLVITQQARAEDQDGVKVAYEKLGLKADVSPFFTDMAERIGKAHFVICRSGASTVSEISVIGRPALFVPYPFALDHDQAANARLLLERKAAEVIAQSKLSPEKLAAIISDAMTSPDRLSAMAQAARAASKPDAAQLLAGLVEAIAAGKTVKEFKDNRT